MLKSAKSQLVSKSELFGAVSTNSREEIMNLPNHFEVKICSSVVGNCFFLEKSKRQRIEKPRNVKHENPFQC